MGYFWTFLSLLRTLSGPTVTLLYPLYASVCAIESSSRVDDEQWLAYWILYSFLTLAGMALDPILCRIPVWYEIKVVVATWMVLPQFRGASFIYQRLVREQLRRCRGGGGGGGEGGAAHRHAGGRKHS